MGRNTRSVIRDRIPQAQLDALIQRTNQREHVSPHPVLTCNTEYDTTHPEETIKTFCSAVRNMLLRYQGCKDRLASLEAEMQDLLHYIEMGSDKNANAGYKLYKQLTEVRRERRITKNEMDLLQPIYDAFGGGDKLNVLAQIQGQCKSAKSMIDNRSYTVRTNVLDQFMK